MPQLQREILSSRLSAEPDLVLVEAPDHLELREAVERTEAEFVIVGAERLAAGEVSGLREARPAVKVLALGANGRGGVLYELRPDRVPLGNLSAEGLVDLIRALRERQRAVALEPPSDHATSRNGSR